MYHALLRRIAGHVPALVLGLVALVAVLIGRNYSMGTLTAMGPGFLPVLLGALLLVLAVLLLWLEAPLHPALPPLRPLIAVAAGMLAWVLLAEAAGFFPAALAQLGLSAMALPQAERRRDLVVALLLSVVAWLLFVRVLGLPLPAFGA